MTKITVLIYTLAHLSVFILVWGGGGLLIFSLLWFVFTGDSTLILRGLAAFILGIVGSIPLYYWYQSIKDIIK